MTLSSMSLVRNPQYPPSTFLLDPPFLTPFYEDINTKFSGYITFGQTRSYMTSKITLSSKSLVRNPQCLQVPSYLTRHSLHTSNTDIHTKFSGHLSQGQTRSSMTSRMTQSSKSLAMNPQYPPSITFLSS